MAIRKRINRSGKTIWWIDLYLPDGSRYRRTVGSKKEAEIAEAKIKMDITNKKWDLKKEDITFANLVKLYLEYTAINRASSTHKADEYRIKANIMPFLGDILIRDITPAMIEEYKVMRIRQGVTTNTINHEITNISAICRTAVRLGFVDKNIISNVDKFKIARRKQYFLGEDEIDSLLSAAEGSHLYPLILTALHTGMRKSELLNLKWDDISFGQNIITIQAKDGWHTKNYKSRSIQMTPVLFDVLSSLPHICEYVFTYKGVKIKYMDDDSMKRIIQRAGLKDVTLHTLRHTFASHLAISGVSLMDIKELMGHQSYETTLQYAHLTQEHVKSQVLRLPFSGSGKNRAKSDGEKIQQSHLSIMPKQWGNNGSNG